MPLLTPTCLIVLLCMAPMACSAFQQDDRDLVVEGCDGQSYPSLSSTPYVLPFPVQTSYKMNLGNCSTSYHGAEYPDRYAYDFGMDIGTIVTASRGGTVVKVEESGTDGTTAVNNLVVVDHGDGTFAEYMHLTHDGALVTVGSMVARGDTLGLSGNTGLAGYPHLHLIVVKNNPAWPYEPVPISFGNASPGHLRLKEGQTYEARPYQGSSP